MLFEPDEFQLVLVRRGEERIDLRVLQKDIPFLIFDVLFDLFDRFLRGLQLFFDLLDLALSAEQRETGFLETAARHRATGGKEIA